MKKIRLGDIAHGRSGDKGNHANIGVIAYTLAGHDHLATALSGDKVKAYFHSLSPEKVDRFDLPRLFAFNFVLWNVLGGGASDSLRTDTQGKALATALLEMELPEPENLAAMLPPEAMLLPDALPPAGKSAPGNAPPKAPKA
ncbi:MAG: hypothetical protein JWP91_2021 [Fibrobacteres bacterium]|nr:hypothetical protein [Fibrobacterota bacterium]